MLCPFCKSHQLQSIPDEPEKYCPECGTLDWFDIEYANHQDYLESTGIEEIWYNENDKPFLSQTAKI